MQALFLCQSPRCCTCAGSALGSAMQAVFSAVIVNPLPNIALFAFRAGDVDGAALAVAAGTTAAAVQRVADARLVAGSEPLAVIIAEGAQAGRVHGPSCMIELLAEFSIHAADDIILQ